MGIACLTFAGASVLHLNVSLALGALAIHGETVLRAAIAEAVIALVLAVGTVAMLIGGRKARVVALAATIFAIPGVLVGLTTIALGIGPRTVPDVTYHVGILMLLGVIMLQLWG